MGGSERWCSATARAPTVPASLSPGWAQWMWSGCIQPLSGNVTASRYTTTTSSRASASSCTRRTAAAPGVSPLASVPLRKRYVGTFKSAAMAAVISSSPAPYSSAVSRPSSMRPASAPPWIQSHPVSR